MKNVIKLLCITLLGLQNYGLHAAAGPAYNPPSPAISKLQELAVVRGGQEIVTRARAQAQAQRINLEAAIFSELQRLPHAVLILIVYQIVFNQRLTREQALALLNNVRGGLPQTQEFTEDLITLDLFLNFINRMPPEQLVDVNYRFKERNSPFQESLLFKMAKR